MSKQLQKLNYAPEEVEISVIGSSTPTTGSLTITQIKTLLASDQNYIKYTINTTTSEYLYFTNFTNNTAFYGADLYNATTSVYYRHLIKISYSSDLSSATWNYYNIPIITGSSSDLQEKLVSGTNIKTINGNSVLGSGDLDTNSNLANTYSSSSAYSVGSYVIYNHQLYKCKTAISSGGEAWNSAHWNLVKVGTQLTSKQDALDDQDLYQDGPIYNSVVGFNSSANLCSGQVPHTAISSTGATSGQVLTADGYGSAAWQTPATYMSNPMNAAGDIIVGGSSGTPERLAKGTAGQVLTMNSGGTAAEWQTPATYMSNPMNAAGDIIVGGASGTPSRLGLGTAGQILKVNSNGDGLEYGSAGGSEIDSDITVEIESNYTSTNWNSRTNYSDPISLKDFIANCESGTYSNAGIIARINKLVNGATYRLLLIGINEDILANNTDQKAKTTWQFLDMPVADTITLGLPFNIIDWGSNSGRTYAKQYLDGTNSTQIIYHPSNKTGIITASALMTNCQNLFNSFPLLLKEHIKLVERKFSCRRKKRTIAASGGTETDETVLLNYSANIFLMTAGEIGYSTPTWDISVYEGHGSKYNYMGSGDKCVRYRKGTTNSWWTASLITNDSSQWCLVGSTGNLSQDVTERDCGFCPMFCI